MGCFDSKEKEKKKESTEPTQQPVNAPPKKTRAVAPVAQHQYQSEQSPEYSNRAVKCIPADVRMFSGCKDEQTSADVSNVESFGLPTVSDVESAGGACTNALLSTLKQQHDITFANLLLEMQSVLKKRKYEQIPQLSTSHQLNLRQEKFTVIHPKGNGSTKSLLIGINYYGHAQGQLAGCVNDVKMMRNFIISEGFDSSSSQMRVLTDDPEFGDAMPSGKNVIAGMRWLVEGAKPGDTLFFHYSGHGGQIPDDNGDEEDGMDETLIPVDYQQSGQIRDDLIYQLLVAPLPQGVHFVAVFDCCHSGTILDLPYEFAMNDSGTQALQSNSNDIEMAANPGFNFDFASELANKVKRGVEDFFSDLGKKFK